MSTKGRQNKKEYESPEMLYYVDGEHPVKMIHEHPGKGYAGTPGAATIDLQSKPKSKEDVVDITAFFGIVIIGDILLILWFDL